MSDYLLFQLEARRFGIPLKETREIVRVEKLLSLPGCPDFISGFLNIRDRAVAVIDLSRHFGLTSQAMDARGFVIVVRVGSLILGLQVSQVLDIFSVRSSSLQPWEETAAAFSRAVVVTGIVQQAGESVLLLDLDKLLSDEDCHRLLSGGLQPAGVSRIREA